MTFIWRNYKYLLLTFLYSLSSIIICLSLFTGEASANYQILEHIQINQNDWYFYFILLLSSQFVGFKLLEYNLSETDERSILFVAMPFGLFFCLIILLTVQLSFNLIF